MYPLELELDPKERDRLFETVARWLVVRRMHVPAILALEMHKPLAFLGSQALVVLTPFLAPAIGLQRMQQLCAVLAQPGAIDRLVDRIEELAYAPEAGGTGASPLRARRLRARRSTQRRPRCFTVRRVTA